MLFIAFLLYLLNAFTTKFKQIAELLMLCGAVVGFFGVAILSINWYLTELQLR